MKELSERSLTVLNDIVEIYTETGLPVGSKALCEKSQLNLSPASLRNVMADLEKNGYLASPHTSAGRAPTEEGFRYYAKSLVSVEEDFLNEEIRKEIEKRIQEDKPLKEKIDSLSAFISDMTSCTGVVTAPRFDMETLDQLEFLRLSDDRVLAVLVTQSGEVENRVVHVPSHISIEKLNESAKHLKDVVAGKTLSDARVLMMQELMEKKHQVDNMMKEMIEVADEWADPTDTDTALVVAGTQNLFQYPEIVRDQLKGLFKVFEEKRLLMALMNEVQKAEGVQIFVGADCKLEEASNFSVVSTSYGNKEKTIVGTLGVVGPMRMNYKKAVQLIDYTGKVLSKALESKDLEVAPEIQKENV
ncbi:MAG: heat-inducible transcription repressor HrcA [Magnetococcales bacterium]|nr:heat-inducible transcription repressor HrcA [Magnetococcales bacterium]MEC8067690.1 heat-inducible transcriptional repressor HrcA [Pseudomonadota bacterium]|tara:strand:- start:26947 stop:28023 length:1077 start_codon:yes stop_codon:yes gene_type:complete